MVSNFFKVYLTINFKGIYDFFESKKSEFSGVGKVRFLRNIFPEKLELVNSINIF